MVASSKPLLALSILTWAVLASGVGGVGGVGGPRPVVEIPDGRLIGINEYSAKGITFSSFYSIPFAKPPVGSLRLKDPEPSEGWQGDRDASSVPPPCIQIPFSATETGDATVVGGEDCLYLNVFTRRPNDTAALRPVLVFIHGGAYFAGSTSKYPPHVMLNEDIVLVTLQYRLGIFGFLSTEDDIMPGNLALKDQTLALGWTKANILNFGGDPSRVTVVGSSAGAASAHFQVLTPKSRGLFQRAILHSGTALCPWSLGWKHRDIAKRVASKHGCPTDEGSAEILRCLQGVTSKDLTEGMFELFEYLHLPLLLGPRVDGDYLPDDPEVLLKEGRYEGVDLLSGVTAHDGGLFALGTYAHEDNLQRLRENVTLAGLVLDFHAEGEAPEELTRRIFEYYLGDEEIGVGNAEEVVKMFTHRTFAIGHDLTVLLHSRDDKHRTFAFEFGHRGQHSISDPFGLPFAKHWVTHADDLFYLFTDEVVWLPLEREEDLALRDTMTAMWANFAATGSPTPDDSLGFRWEATEGENLRYLSLIPTPVMKEDSRQEVRDFYGTLATRQNRLLKSHEKEEL